MKAYHLHVSSMKMNLRHPHSAASNGCGTLFLSWCLSLFCAALLCCTVWYLQVLCGQVSCWNAEIGHLLRDRAYQLPVGSQWLECIWHKSINSILLLNTLQVSCVCVWRWWLCCCMWENKGNSELLCGKICSLVWNYNEQIPPVHVQILEKL